MALMAAFASHTSAQILVDDFSTGTSADYNVIQTYEAHGGTTGTYATTSGEFNPVISNESTYYFLRNDGYKLNAGDTVSLDLDAILNTSNAAAGLGLGTSLTSAGATGYGTGSVANNSEIILQKAGSTYNLLGTGLTGITWTQANPLTLSITRQTDGTDYSVSLTGSGFTTLSSSFSNSGTPLGIPVYFGPSLYTGNGNPTTVQQGEFFDNLTYTSAASVPEPSTWAMLLGGVLMLGVVIRVRRQA